MQARSETWMDKSTWGDGPWQDEPDRVEWRIGEFVALARRNRMGAWCGYIGLPPGHPWHGLHAFGDEHNSLDDIEVHGGINYTDACMVVEGMDPQELVCHTPLPGESDDVWWLGFDCLHAWDIGPAMDAQMREAGLAPMRPNDIVYHYRDVAYVTREVEHLAEQADAALQQEEQYPRADRP